MNYTFAGHGATPLIPCIAMLAQALPLWGLHSWTLVAIPAAGLIASGFLFLLGWLLFGERGAAKQATDEEEQSSSDPFIEGSSSERRTAPRRRGNSVPILVSDADGVASPRHGIVVDRSIGGLGLRLDLEVPVGSVITVRPEEASPGASWIQVEVIRCTQVGDSWRVGCQFLRTPAYATLLLFG